MGTAWVLNRETGLIHAVDDETLIGRWEPGDEGEPPERLLRYLLRQPSALAGMKFELVDHPSANGAGAQPDDAA